MVAVRQAWIGTAETKIAVDANLHRVLIAGKIERIKRIVA
jgi:hypothetical protein